MAGNGNGNGDLAFTADLFRAADKLRGNLEPSEYKHVALGLIFLKYISDAFEAQRAKLAAEDACRSRRPGGIPRRERLLGAEGGPLVLSASERQAARDRQADRRRDGGHREGPVNEALKGVLPKNYARPTLNKTMLGELIDLISNIGMHDGTRPGAGPARPGLRIFPRPASPVPRASAAASSTRRARSSRTLVEMLEPYKGRVYDPCCGSGGMFVQSEKFVEEHGGRRRRHRRSTARRSTTPPGGWRR